MAEAIDPTTLEAARRIIADHDNSQKEAIRRQSNERLEQTLEMAMMRMGGDPEMAANLFQRWSEQDDGVRELLKPLIREAIEGRLARIPRPDFKSQIETKAAQERIAGG
jgi:hypothetical protein